MKIKFDRKHIALYAYAAIVVLIGIMFLANIFGKSAKQAEYGLEDYENISSDWTFSDGSKVIFSENTTYKTESGTQCVYYTIPQITKDETLVFRSKNAYVKVYVGEELFYETHQVSAPFYNHSPGTRWNMIRFTSKEVGENVRIEITPAYADQRAKVDNIYLGDRAAIVLDLIEQKAVGLVLCLMIISVGFLYIIANFIVNSTSNILDSSLLYLGWFAILAGTWCLLETNVFQLFSNNLRLIQFTDDAMLVIAGVPLFFYMDSVYNIFAKKWPKILCIANVIYVGCAVISELCGGPDFHQTLNGAIVTYGVIVFLFLFCLLVQRKQARKDAKNNRSKIIFYRFQELGFACLGVGIAADLIAYLNTDVMDRAFNLRIGLLMFIIFFGSGNIYRMVKLVKQGIRTEIVEKLAYSDGLTNVGNRTAYMEKITKLEGLNQSGSLGLIMLDINNLKWTNDHMGHKMGDQLICKCAEVIEKTFGTLGAVYRIGGDEFVIVIEHTNAEKEYNDMLPVFLSEMEHADEEQNAYQVSIAYGFAYADYLDAAHVEDAIIQVDSRMYEQKRLMKKMM